MRKLNLHCFPLVICYCEHYFLQVRKENERFYDLLQTLFEKSLKADSFIENRTKCFN